jgi:TolA-binding protein
MTEPLDPLPPDVASLFDDERAAPGLPPAMRERLRERLASLGPVPLPPGDGGGGGGEAGGAAGGAAGTGAGLAAGGGAAAVKSAIASKIGIAAIAFGVGSVSGAAVHATLAPPSARPPAAVATAPPAIAPAATASPPMNARHGAGTEADAAVPEDAGSVAAVARPSAEARDDHRSVVDRMKRERASLEVARTAITRRDYVAALAALDRHAREFPRGQLAEERESMRIQALVGQGRNDEARERAARFHRDFPDSLLQGSVDATIRSIP